MADPYEDIHGNEVAEIILGFHQESITRKTFFKRMAALGYQQVEALKLAESWDDDI